MLYKAVFFCYNAILHGEVMTDFGERNGNYDFKSDTAKHNRWAEKDFKN